MWVIKLFAGIAVFILVIGFIPTCMYAYPKYKVYSQEHTGKANLARAEGEKLIMIETAKAEKESAKLRAEAIAIVGEAAKKYPEYRHQEFIGAFGEALQQGKINQIIYVPTEANIPLMEAGKR